MPASNEREQRVSHESQGDAIEKSRENSTQQSALSIQPDKRHSDVMQIFAQGGIFAGGITWVGLRCTSGTTAMSYGKGD